MVTYPKSNVGECLNDFSVLLKQYNFNWILFFNKADHKISYKKYNQGQKLVDWTTGFWCFFIIKIQANSNLKRHYLAGSENLI